MKSYLTRLGREYPEDVELTMDAFTGYGVTSDRQYMEILICQEGQF